MPRSVRRGPSPSVRRWLTYGLLLALGWIAAAFALLLPGPTAGRREPPSRPLHGPSLSELDRSLDLADRFIAGLYRPVGPAKAVMSEYYGLPLRAHFPRMGKWLLVGGSSGTSLTPAANRYSREAATASFAPAGQGGAEMVVGTQVDWDAGRSGFRVTVTNRHFDHRLWSAELYLDSLRLARFTAANVGARRSLFLHDSAAGHLHSFRWTVRHGAQEGHNYFRYRGDERRAAELANLMRGLGFRVNYDITAPIWGQARADPDSFLYEPAAYHDCEVAPPSTPSSYPYRSKVCRVSRAGYVSATHSDTLVPAAQAIHILYKYGTPGHRYRDMPVGVGDPLGFDPLSGAGITRTPRTAAAQLEATFRRLGFGIPRCTPVSCDAWASGVRTFQFGALETSLGYHYGDRISRAYADAAARLALDVQVRENGLVHTTTGTYLRPAVVGGFYTGWDARHRLAANRNGLGRVLDHLDMPAEYRGLVPSNSETTLTAYAFLVHYRCARYRVGCQTRAA